MTDTKRLRTTYFKSRQFKLDLLSILPTDFLHFLPVPQSINMSPTFFQHRPIGRLNRLIRYIFQIPFHTFPCPPRLPRAANFVDRTETRSSYPNAFRVFCVVCYIIILIHWNACAYFALSLLIGLGSDDWVYGWRNYQSRSNFR